VRRRVREVKREAVEWEGDGCVQAVSGTSFLPLHA